MEIKPYIVDEEAINRRKNIQPFGLIRENQREEYTNKLEKPPVFNTTTVMGMEEESEPENRSYVYKPKYKPKKKEVVEQSGIYIAPSLRYEQVSIKITNLPLDIDRRKLETLLMDKFRLVPTSTNVVTDRDTRESRGFAYVSFLSMEKAKEAVERINGHIIEHIILGAEIAKSN